MAKTITYRLKQVFKDGKVRRTELEAEMLEKLEMYKADPNVKKSARKALQRHLDEIEGEAQFLQDLLNNAKTGIWDTNKSKKWFVGRNFQEWGSCITAAEKLVVLYNGKIAITIDHITGLDLNRFFLAPRKDEGKAGSIPPSIGNLKYITSLDMCFNFLVGSIPTTIGKLVGLTTLKLEFNQLHGKLPSEMSQLTALNKVCIDHNRLEGYVSVFGKLPNLKELNIHENKFSGTLPEILASRLTHCWFYRNNLKYGSDIANKIDDKEWKAEDDTEK